jgi:high-affinity Fe2+/Pb2+ permease
MRPPDAGAVNQRRIVIAATACAVLIAVAIARGGLESGGAVAGVALLLVFVRVAFRLLDEAERREEERGLRR